jgi:uncharacterized delta-60 repeat protein
MRRNVGRALWLALVVVLAAPGPAAVTGQGASGALDPSFGAGGRVVIDLGGRETAYAVAVQGDGRIVAAGQTDAHGTPDIALLRLNPDGSLDPSFGSGGWVVTDLGGSDAAFAVAVQPDDGKIVVAGVRDADFALLRYTPDGRPDPSFGSGGVVTAPIASDDPAVLFALRIQDDGKIIVAASAGFALARFLPDGGLDPAFGSGGMVPAPGSRPVLALAVGLAGDRIRVAAVSRLTYELTQYNADGSFDLGYGNAATRTATLGGGLDGVYAVAFDPAGRAMAAGVGPGGHALARYAADLSLDRGFGEGGRLPTQSVLEAYALAIVADGKVVLAGATDGDIALARFETVAPGETLVADTFDDPNAGALPRASTEPARRRLSVQGGEYVVEKVDPADGRGQGAYVPGVYGDVTLAVDARVVGDPGGQVLHLICRWNTTTNSGYRLSIGAARGTVTVERIDEGALTRLVGAQVAPVRTGNAPNHIELTCAGDIIAVAVNGTRVAAVQDAAYLQGRAWIGVGVFSDRLPGTAEGRFGNLRVTRALPSASGDVLLADGFDDPAAGILTASSSTPDRSRSAYEDGEYVVEKVDRTMAGSYVVFLPAYVADAVLAVQARLTGEVAGRFVLLLCRRGPSGDDGYGLLLDPDRGRVRLLRYDGGRGTTLAEEETAAGRRGGDPNLIELSCAGDTIAATVNGRPVVAARDGRYREGRAAIGVGTFGGTTGAAAARFDALVLRRP